MSGCVNVVTLMGPDWDRQTEEFDEVWRARRQPPSVTVSWVDNEWAKGRTDYLTFLVRVRDGAVVDRLKAVQERLAEYECVDPFPEDYLHVTVKELDRFLVREKAGPDEITLDELPALCAEAEGRLGRLQPFRLRLERLNNFKSTVCVEAHDGGVIRGINGALLQVPGMRRLRNDHPRFLPHVSVAQYRSAAGYDKLVDYLEQSRGVEAGSMLVDSVELVVAELPVLGRYPKLRTLRRFNLEERQ